MRVLLVDDDPALSEMLVKYLAGEGISTAVAFNGQDGVTAALTQQFDAIILDVMLPGMDGNEVLRRVRRESAVPIIMLTAKGGDLDRVIGLEMGADDYLAKPYYPPELVARLRAVLRRPDILAQMRPDVPLDLLPCHLMAMITGEQMLNLLRPSEPVDPDKAMRDLERRLDLFYHSILPPKT